VTIYVVPPRNRLTLSGSYQVRMIESPEIRRDNLAKETAPREGPSPWYRRLSPSMLGKQHSLKRGDPTDDMSTSCDPEAKQQAFVIQRHTRRARAE
jgi:hypothetical protein